MELVSSPLSDPAAGPAAVRHPDRATLRAPWLRDLRRLRTDPIRHPQRHGEDRHRDRKDRNRPRGRRHVRNHLPVLAVASSRSKAGIHRNSNARRHRHGRKPSDPDTHRIGTGHVRTGLEYCKEKVIFTNPNNQKLC